MKKHFFKTTLTALLCVSCISTSAFCSDVQMTRGETADYLLKAASAYNPNLKKSDIIKGYGDGNLYEDKEITKSEALVMLNRAFNTLPKPVGHNKRMAVQNSFSDIPSWASDELKSVLDAGIVLPEADGSFSGENPIDISYLNTMCKRTYSLIGTNEKDDFYAAVNKNILDNITLDNGRAISGTLYDLNDKATEEVSEIINDILSGSGYQKGTPEQKIYDFYTNVRDKESREKTGIAPIQKYLDQLDGVKDISELNKFFSDVSNNLYTGLFCAFTVGIDLKDSTKYILSFATVSPSLPKDFYQNASEAQYNSYIKYIKGLLLVAGETEENALNHAKAFYNFEKRLSEASLNPEQLGDVDKIYNIFTYDEIKNKFKNLDIDTVFANSGLKKEDRIMINDTNLTDAIAGIYTNENIEELKAVAKINLISSLGSSLSDKVSKLSQTFNEEYLGIQGSYSDDEKAVLTVQSFMADYIGKIYSQKYFDEKSKADVTKMIKDIISVYEKRLDSLEWMSEQTKQKAKEKLNAITIKVGYPDNFESYLDNADIKSKSEGGSYFDNIICAMKASRQSVCKLQGTNVDKSEWAMQPFTVNACYSPTSNDITFPAAILQSPMYDVNASYEENLGGIGYIIAHEITHAFDNNGAKFDKNGNAADWWTKEDYEQFTQLCEKVKAFYDNQESAPGICANGTLTLSENIADLGAVACITQVLSTKDNPDYKKFYTQISKCWASSTSREFASYLSLTDVHSPDKLRVNRTIVNCDAFYTAFDIKEGDAMYVAPKDRIRIW